MKGTFSIDLCLGQKGPDKCLGLTFFKLCVKIVCSIDASSYAYVFGVCYIRFLIITRWLSNITEWLSSRNSRNDMSFFGWGRKYVGFWRDFETSDPIK